MKKLVSILISVFLINSCLTIIASQTVLAEGATLSLSPSSYSYEIGEVFPVSIEVHTGEVPINAGEATLNFPTDLLEVIGLSKSGSIFTLWTSEPAYSNSYGAISFGGGIPGSIYNGSSGKILTINFRVKRGSQASVNFSKARILAADGKGTNILGNTEGGIYTFKPKEEYIPQAVLRAPAAPKISSLTHPTPEKWYSNNDPEFSWEVPSDITAVKLLIGKIPTAAPIVLYIPPIERKKLEGLGDGIWYFHVQFKNKDGWGKITHRKVLIDTEPPKFFEIKKVAPSEITPPEVAPPQVVLPEATPSGYSTVMLFLSVIIGILILIIIYSRYRFSIEKKRIRRETKEIKKSVRKVFRALREEVGEQIECLDKKSGLTKREKDICDKLQEALDISEEFIRKEIKDIVKELE